MSAVLHIPTLINFAEIDLESAQSFSSDSYKEIVDLKNGILLYLKAIAEGYGTPESVELENLQKEIINAPAKFKIGSSVFYISAKTNVFNTIILGKELKKHGWVYVTTVSTKHETEIYATREEAEKAAERMRNER